MLPAEVTSMGGYANWLMCLHARCNLVTYQSSDIVRRLFDDERLDLLVSKP